MPDTGRCPAPEPGAGDAPPNTAAGFATTDSFDADLDLRAWGMGGVPETIAVCALTVLAWSLSIGGTLALAVFTSPGPVTTGLLRMAVPVLALLAAWRMTRLFVRPLHRLFSDEPGVPDLGRAQDRAQDRDRDKGSQDVARVEGPLRGVSVPSADSVLGRPGDRRARPTPPPPTRRTAGRGWLRQGRSANRRPVRPGP
ncbi:hypothetical protein [Streptomyces sp. AC550_RSS872]|uniref:hypothetical protein n=1 Tax=Streptomyces sp. AC550_RSS872 TaxID=2823689 RepID=UPI001C25DAE6|nr:hypothetical protein [Streptomyces sp. AC550_RSS872]